MEDKSNQNPNQISKPNNVKDQPNVNVKHLKVGYHYLISNAVYILLIPLFSIILVHLSTLSSTNIIVIYDELKTNIMYLAFSMVILLYVSMCYFMSRPRPVYLVDFSCYKPGPENKKVSTQKKFMEETMLKDIVSEQNQIFMTKVVERSGVGEKTYLPELFMKVPLNPGLVEAREEAEMMILDVIDEVLMKTGVEGKDIGILIVNCSMFCPIPSLSAMVVNKYNMREDVRSFNFAGMGCSGTLVGIDLAKHLLQVHKDTYVLIASTENIVLNWYTGNNRSMLLPNCLFRLGAAAILLSNRTSERRRSKYQLVHSVRTNQSANDRSYSCVVQREDENGIIGVGLSKDLMEVAGEVLTINIKRLSPLVLPISEQLLFLANLLMRKVLKMEKIKPYVPDFKLAFEHFIIHAGGKAVLDAVEKSLDLTPWHMEPARMALHRFGNTSTSSLWYVLAYAEAKGRVQKGDRLWKISFGAGYKCNSLVLRALRRIDPAEEKSVWMDEIHEFPITVPNFTIATAST